MLDIRSSPLFTSVHKCVASAKIVGKEEETYNDFRVWRQISTGQFFYTFLSNWAMQAPVEDCEKIVGFTYTMSKPFPRYASALRDRQRNSIRKISRYVKPKTIPRSNFLLRGIVHPTRLD